LSRILNRFSTYDLCAEHSKRFVGIAFDWVMAAKLAAGQRIKGTFFGLTLLSGSKGVQIVYDMAATRTC
jgi:hypothetical protein